MYSYLKLYFLRLKSNSKLQLDRQSQRLPSDIIRAAQEPDFLWKLVETKNLAKRGLF